MPANSRFLNGEIGGKRPWVNFQLLTQPSTHEKARASASDSEMSRHITNPKVGCLNRGPTTAGIRCFGRSAWRGADYAGFRDRTKIRGLQGTRRWFVSMFATSGRSLPKLVI